VQPNWIFPSGVVQAWGFSQYCWTRLIQGQKKKKKKKSKKKKEEKKQKKEKDKRKIRSAIA